MAGDRPFGGEEWTEEFMDAAREAVTAAVEEHHRAGRPAYFMGDDGDICECSPDKRVRKLRQAEIKWILAEI